MSKKKTQRPSALKNIVVFGIIILIVITVLFLIINNTISGIDAVSQRTEKDYSTHTYTIEKIMESQITENGTTKYRYEFIKPEAEEFNLSLPIKLRNTDNYTEHLSIGDKIEVKVYTPELNEMQSGSILNKIKRFMQQDNREVEVYRLTVDNNIIFDKNILDSDVNFRKGGGLFTSRLLFVLLGFAAVVYIIGVIRNKPKKKKK